MTPDETHAAARLFELRTEQREAAMLATIETINRQMAQLEFLMMRLAQRATLEATFEERLDRIESMLIDIRRKLGA
jgi:hypothetical protein